MLHSDDHKVIIMRVDSDGIPVKKYDINFYSPRSPMRKPGDITFVASTCLAYIPWEELELPPQTKPLEIVFVLERRVLSAIFRREMEGTILKEVWLKLVLSGPTVGATVLVQKYIYA